MASKNIVKLAKQYAKRYHVGQMRNNPLPYIVHPENVAKYLKFFGVNDEKTLAVAWLHDTLEDTSLTYDMIKNVFGMDIANGVYLLTRNINREEYKKRLVSSPNNIKLIKLCDTLDNIRTLEYLSFEGIERKIKDCISYYIPMAQEICSPIASNIKKYIFDYLQSYQLPNI